jgi:hypothetical protein
MEFMSQCSFPNSWQCCLLRCPDFGPASSLATVVHRQLVFLLSRTRSWLLSSQALLLDTGFNYNSDYTGTLVFHLFISSRNIVSVLLFLVFLQHRNVVFIFSFMSADCVCILIFASVCAAMAEIHVLLPINSLERIEERDARLFRHLRVQNLSTGARRCLCPCKICNRGLRSNLLVNIVYKHLHLYGRHPQQRGPSEVFPRFHYVIYAIVLLIPFPLKVELKVNMFSNTGLCLEHGFMQGVSMDESDDEWEKDVARCYGVGSPRISQPKNDGGMQDLDLTTYLRETFEVGDQNHEAAVDDGLHRGEEDGFYFNPDVSISKRRDHQGIRQM